MDENCRLVPKESRSSKIYQFIVDKFRENIKINHWFEESVLLSCFHYVYVEDMSTNDW